LKLSIKENWDVQMNANWVDWKRDCEGVPKNEKGSGCSIEVFEAGTTSFQITIVLKKVYSNIDCTSSFLLSGSSIPQIPYSWCVESVITLLQKSSQSVLRLFVRHQEQMEPAPISILVGFRLQNSWPGPYKMRTSPTAANTASRDRRRNGTFSIRFVQTDSLSRITHEYSNNYCASTSHIKQLKSSRE
jgi:hypothetical protein